MRYSYNWLKELSGTKKSPEQLAELLMMHSFEVEGMESVNTTQGKKDYLIDIDVLANRGHDALSHIGIAREICALENRKLKYDFKKLPDKKSKKIKVEIRDKKLCPRYVGAVLENVEIKESPQWAKDLLAVYNINSINNVVDATNYVMLELGQPMHAFDFDKIANDKRIIVRLAKDREKIKLLDGQEKELAKDDLVIADSEKALAIAGIKGGDYAAVTKETKKIILESANFNFAAIRKTRMKLEMQTDASARFEKEIDPNLAGFAMARAIQILEAFGCEVEGVADIYTKKTAPWKIKLDLSYVNKLLGENISAKIVLKILNSLELKTSGIGKNITIEIPTFRIDLKTQEDLIEEIGRIYGYEKIKSIAPMAPVQAAETNEQRMFERAVKNILVGNGFSEVYNYSFYSAHDAGLAQLGTIKHLELANPQNPDQALLRVSLIPNILKNIRENLKNFKEFEIFECGKVYWPDSTVLPREKRILAGAVVLLENSEQKTAGNRNKAETFFKAKGYVDNLLKNLGAKNFYYDNFNSSPIETFDTLWHSGRRAEIKIEGYARAIGFLGEINPLVLADFDIHKRVAMFEFDLDALKRDLKIKKEFMQIRKHPIVTRDISMLSDKKNKVADIIKAIKKNGGNLVLDAYLFDIFQKDGKNSFAFRIEFGADDRTLESGKIDGLMKKIISDLEKNLKVEVRK